MRTGGAWCSRCSSTPKTGGKRSAACLSCARRWMPSRIPSTACSSTAVAAAGQVPGSRAGRSPRRARLPFRCPGPRTSRIWIWRLSPHRPPGRRRQGRYSGRRIHAVPGLAGMTLTDTVPVLRPSVRGTEELAAIGRSVTGRECLKTVPCAGTADMAHRWLEGMVMPAAPNRQSVAPRLGAKSPETAGSATCQLHGSGSQKARDETACRAGSPPSARRQPHEQRHKPTSAHPALPAGMTVSCLAGRNRRSRRLLETTKTELNAIAAPAIGGWRNSRAVSGITAVL